MHQHVFYFCIYVTHTFKFVLYGIDTKGICDSSLKLGAEGAGDRVQVDRYAASPIAKADGARLRNCNNDI